MMHSFCRAGDVVFGFGNIQSSSCQALLSPGEYSSGHSQCVSRQIFFPCHTMTEHLLLCWKHFLYTCRNALSWILELWCVWPALESRLCSSSLCFQWCYIGSWKSGMVRVFIPEKLANITNQGLFFPSASWLFTIN